MTNEDVLQRLQHLIGTPYAPAVKAYITEVTGRPRVVGPGDISTKEVDRNRVNIAVDDAGLITAFHFV